MNIFVDDLIRALAAIHNDGYRYCTIDFFDEDECDGDILPPSIMLSGLDEGGEQPIEYSDSEVEEVPDDEISRYAYVGRTSAPRRKAIKKIRLEEF